MTEEVQQDSNGDVWVVIETHKGVGAIYSYRGKLTRGEIDAWVAGELQGAISLRSAYWVNEENGRRVPVVIGRHGGSRNGTGILHIAADTIVIVMELRAPDAGVLDDLPGQVVQLDAVRKNSQPPPAPAPEDGESGAESDRDPE